MNIYVKSLLAILVFGLMQALAGIAIAPFALLTGSDSPSPTLLGTALILANILTVLIVWRKMHMIRLPETFSTKTLDLRTSLLSVLAALSGILATNLLSETMDLPNILEDSMMGLSTNIVGLIAIAVAGPVTEELLFREAIQGSMLRSGIAPWKAMAFSAVCFGIIHFNPAQIPFACIVGLILAYIYYRTGNIVLTTIIHVVNNSVACIEMNVMGERAADFTYTDMLGGETMAFVTMASCTAACILLLWLAGRKALLLLTAIAPALVHAQDMTHEVESDTTRWQVPKVEEAWKLELMPHNNANHNVYVYKDKLYDALFTRSLGWNGGDGVQTTMLPDGNVFWSFNDSFYGRATSATRARGNCNFPRNSIMVQTSGEDGLPGTDDNSLIWLADWVNKTYPSRERYYHCRTHLRHPMGEKTEAEIKAGDIDQQYLYWAGDATVVDGTLQMLWAGVYNGTENLMQSDNRALAIYSLEGKPGDDTYLKLLSVDHSFFEKDPIGYGQTLWEDEDGHTYLYSCNQFKKNEADLLNTSSPVVARTTTHDLRSKWEYYIADANGTFHWQDTYPTAEEVNRSAISSRSVSTAWVFKDGDYYYMTAQGFVFSKQVYIMRSKHPWGPFEECHQLWTMPYVLDKKGKRTYQNFYMPHLHQSLSREGELVFSTNTDAKDWGDNFNSVGSADFYRPFFFRIYNWKAIFDK